MPVFQIRICYPACPTFQDNSVSAQTSIPYWFAERDPQAKAQVSVSRLPGRAFDVDARSLYLFRLRKAIPVQGPIKPRFSGVGLARMLKTSIRPN
jgi:hypothetical protein